jgi:hypothetical protein
MASLGVDRLLLIEEDKDWSLLHDLTPTAALLLGFVDHAPPPFGSLSTMIHSTRMHVSFSIASANMSAVLPVHHAWTLQQCRGSSSFFFNFFFCDFSVGLELGRACML